MICIIKILMNIFRSRVIEKWKTENSASKCAYHKFRDVSFRYAGQKHNALNHINITLSPGEKLSIVGENGAGKTTFIKLLTRLYDPTDGEIFLDGLNIKDIDYDSYMSVFSTVFQDYKLFAFSLQENVALGLPQDKAKVESALRRVGFGDRLDRLKMEWIQRYIKNFDAEGFEPSGGESQKSQWQGRYTKMRRYLYWTNRLLRWTQERNLKSISILMSW